MIEYKIVRHRFVPGKEAESLVFLNEMGAEGWAFVGPLGDGYHSVVFKRVKAMPKASKAEKVEKTEPEKVEVV